jgi:hypothetical protein
MPSSVAGLVTAGATNSLPMPSYMFGLLAVLGFALLLGVTWAFRGAHHKYAPPVEHSDESDSHH